ncbi:nucleotidyl transferase AbiEii/AbiGii toxin family protein [Candidatus Peregrinibacteria bacterium]|nr:nucleotidyl transferase AbiEii/AbiGii toxin family protein [Candidatus Peregrinibacteria bacterium]
MKNPYRELFQAMNEADIQYLVVGGVAVNLHGYSRFTGDLDILLALNTSNLDRLALLMEREGFIQRLPVDVQLLSDRKQVQQWIVDKGITAYTFIDPKLPQFSMDIIIGESLDFESYDRKRLVLDVGDLPIPVVSIDDLIGMKQRANRKKDIEDVAALLELKGL